MGSPATIDFDALTAPIAGERPAGSDLRLAPGTPAAAKYSQLALLRKQASSLERNGAPDKLLEAAAAWRSMRTIAIDLLSTQSKDIQVCAWLIECLARQNGFAGLRDGFRLARELVEKFWDALYPTPEPGEPVSARIAPLFGLNGVDATGTLLAPIGMVAITKEGADGAYASYQWVNANTPYRGNTEDPSAQERQAQKETQNKALQEKIESAAKASGRDFYLALRDDLQGANDELTRLDEAVTARCGGPELPTSALSKALVEVQDAVVHIAKELLPPPPAPASDTVAAADGTVNGSAEPAMNGAIATRDDAFTVLRRVSDYFREAEPHSPLSYMVEQVIRYGGLSLPDLLTELIPDQGTRENLFIRTGIQPPAK